MSFQGVHAGRFLLPDLLLYWGLPHREPKGHRWSASCGTTVLGHSRHGLPFLRARVVLIYLTTKLGMEGRTFSGSLAEINEWFEIDWPLDNLEKHFLRVVYAHYGCGDRCICEQRTCHGKRNPVAFQVDYDPTSYSFRITLSSHFKRAMQNGVWSPCRPIRRLAQTDQMAALDLYTFYMMWWQQRPVAFKDTFGDSGPFMFLKSAKARYRKRRELMRLHQRVVEIWPDCPFHLAANGNRITCNADRRQRVRRICKHPPRGRGRKPKPVAKLARGVRKRPLRKRPTQPYRRKPLQLDEYRPERKQVFIYTSSNEEEQWNARTKEIEAENARIARRDRELNEP